MHEVAENDFQHHHMSSGQADPSSSGGTLLVEQTGDLHEYGLSLGVNIDVEEEEDLVWIVQEAFDAPLPGSWTEYVDNSGRAYYVKEGSSESTWEHPLDSVYREIIELVKHVRAGHVPNSSESDRFGIVREHLQSVHRRAKAELTNWSGPYMSEQGEYYFNDIAKFSTWHCPITDWEQELSIRHAVLTKCLLPDQDTQTSPSVASVNGGASVGNGPGLLQTLKLQLSNIARDAGDADVPQTPSTARFHSARSACSSRSGKAARSETKRVKAQEAPRPPQRVFFAAD